MIVLRASGQALVAGTWTGLVLASGFLVLMTVLVVRSVGRQSTRGEAAELAVLEGIAEVSRAVLAGGLLAVAVFAAFGPEAGPGGLGTRPITIAFAAALAAGLVSTYTLLPVLARGILRRPDGRSTAGSERASTLQRGYVQLIRASFIHRRAALLLCTLALALALLALPRPVSTGQMLGLVTVSAMLLACGLALVEAVTIYRSHGVPLREALILGGQSRIEPIAVATLAMGLVILPAWFDVEGGPIFTPGLAPVVLWGLVVFLPLLAVLVPTLFGLAEGAKQHS
jgi:multidrug efflux pump subunit AcrB